ncbi:ubiquitin domain-containing protein DSK2, putative (DSK2) [Plasmodium ovale wallikeri]|uniref:Ubiquitin domain-containing protein DSK2, putative (DSK2) n=1 Tax=Plasmodium ovale wallikeri TaxID=864142 RepID=A0A1A8YTQ4_PLAOA|nr:ubiquitin domain-containing protein DSK2, putative (DSK2) [Plasmodium ovale wallikeri]SBT35475.1 ubiquitin domain-containing protein DSK2, putative (DSK2) [Plasmodium ovale wallikeri]
MYVRGYKEQEKMTINVSFKVTGGKEFTISIEPDITVLELKQKCSEHVDIPVESQRIIFKGLHRKGKNGEKENVEQSINAHAFDSISRIAGKREFFTGCIRYGTYYAR